MRSPRFRMMFLALIALALLSATLPADESQTPAKPAKKQKDYYQGTLISMGAGPRMPTLTFTIYVKEYTTPEEAHQLGEILKTQGQEGLVKALAKIQKGNISVGRGVGYNIGFMRLIDTPEGRVVRIATNRPISIPELWMGGRSRDYDLGFIELKLNAEGKGEGLMIFAGQAKFTGESLEIENYSIQPAKLLGVRLRH